MRRLFFLLMSVLLTPALALGGERLTIAAASDLRYALTDIVADYEKQHPDQDIEVIFGSSGKMTTQILNGAPYDLFFSADIAYPRKLHAAGLAASEPAVYAIGRIVLWSRRLDAARLTLQDLTRDDIGRIAIASPDHAPYGARAREALQAAGVWEAVQPKLVFGENIAHAAQMAASGAADVGIIALSLALFPDLAAQPHALIDAGLHAPLLQAHIVTRHGADNPRARDFDRYLRGPAAHAVMARYGFVVPDPEP